MNFTVALLIIVALGSIVLGLVCYHLLSRLDLIERSVLGGLEPPTRRLTREEFEQRFSRAVARHQLAVQVKSGLVIVLGAESLATERATNEVIGALQSLQRGDGIVLIAAHEHAQAAIAELELPGLLTQPFNPELGISLTPHALVIDDSRVIAARPTPSSDDLLALVSTYT